MYHMVGAALSARGSSLNKWQAGQPLLKGKVVTAVTMPPQAYQELQGKQNKANFGSKNGDIGIEMQSDTKTMDTKM